MADRTSTFYAASTNAIHGYGFELQLGDGASPEVFESIAAVTLADPGATETEDIEVTHGRSPNAHREHLAGMRDSGEITFEGVYLPTEDSHATAGGGSGIFTSGGLPYINEQRTIHNWRIKYPTSPAVYLEVTGYLKRFQPTGVGVDDAVKFAGSIMPTQAYTLP